MNQSLLNKIYNIINKQCLIIDKRKLLNKYLNLKKQKNIDADKLVDLQLEVDEAYTKFLERCALVPNLSYPEELPISQKREEILHAIKSSQVVIVSGATGSGKTTQLPKICLEAGLGTRGIIGHTQPRRIAARTVASRIAEELGVEIGGLVGYKVRFTDHTSNNSLIKIMTDGILLSELTQDHYLNKYDTIIIDEAHERSLNIDFLLGYLKKIIEKRHDLKIIITSATIDVETFSKHFNNAPIIEVSGRTYPVETRYRPPIENDDNEDNDLSYEILSAINELGNIDLGDILVFLDGERSIYEICHYLNKCNLKHTEVLPLYARLSVEEQNKIFQPHSGRHIVLATNVAETSLTVPGIKYVIDTGIARISRYSTRTKVQRLPIEPISQASADQRKGRCGRTAPGICIRLYDETEFLGRPQFTDPEILRTNLASVILQMHSLKLGDISEFPFINPPESKQITDGIKLLEEIGALSNGSVTKIGQLIAKFPIEPRFAKMLITAQKLGCLSEMLIIVSGLSIQDPRERPLNKKNESQQCHQRFNDDHSDFIALLNLWKYFHEIVEKQSYSQLRKICRKEFLSYLRLREWEDLHSQLSQVCKEENFKLNIEEADYTSIHRAITSGLLSHIGTKTIDSNEYVGARNQKFLVAFTSGLHKKKPKWIISADLAETTRLYARNIAEIQTEWLEEFGKDLIKRSYSDIHWSKKSGSVVANMQLSLYGLPIVTNRLVQYSKIDPVLCRELFIRNALVEGDFNCNLSFFTYNQKLIDKVLDEEDKARRKDILISDNDLFAFYDQKIPEDVNSFVTLNKWYEKQVKEDNKLLYFNYDFLISDTSKLAGKNDFPNYINIKRFKVKLEYHFDPTAEDDGVTAIIPMELLNQIEVKDFDFIVPGLQIEFFTAVIKSLPKNLRKLFIPAPTFAQCLLESIPSDTKNLWKDIIDNLTRIGGIVIKREDFNEESIPKHLKYNFRIIGSNKKIIKEGRDLNLIKKELESTIRDNLHQIIQTNKVEKKIVYTNWTFGSIEQKRYDKLNSMHIVSYPGMCDVIKGVELATFEDPLTQKQNMLIATRRLILLNANVTLSFISKSLSNQKKLGLYNQNIGSTDDIVKDCISCGIDQLMKHYGAPVWNQNDFEQLIYKIKGDINDITVEIVDCVAQILLVYGEISKKLKGNLNLRTAINFANVKNELESLIYKGFITEAGYEHIFDHTRYIQALLKRIEKINLNPHKDLINIESIDEVKKEWQKLCKNFNVQNVLPEDVKNVKWMIEEYKVSLNAQQLKTKFPISSKRIKDEISRLREQYNF